MGLSFVYVFLSVIEEVSIYVGLFYKFAIRSILK